VTISNMFFFCWSVSILLGGPPSRLFVVGVSVFYLGCSACCVMLSDVPYMQFFVALFVSVFLSIICRITLLFLYIYGLVSKNLSAFPFYVSL
jgi:hypothetical protein